ncbi:putative MFS-type transporter protein [Lachnellula hyalina]|uniref:Putative MFS-type transporter protein n=1 Tax=Lachnellula hyalina TaxID=1316788 RepID=A0A8H8TVX9_9HELO|nr:putative MFS-type transporter protein [Lachnellula hyalina]TVY24294.1 putative MFS-type transporter protein [Lachnellula hyalina]
MAHHLHSDVLPGTVHLVDLAGTLNVRHEEGGEKDIVLLPQPTNEHDDPLNWTRPRKLLSVDLMLLAVLSGCFMTTLLSVSLLDIEKDTGIPLATLNSGVGVQYLFYGWSNLLWQPLGLSYGRRPVILVGAVGMLACSVWTAYVSSSGEWYANRLLIGAFYGPIETLIEVCISDVYFAHERGFWVGMYCCILYGSPFLGGIPTGFIATNLGWQWIQFIVSIIAGGCLLAAIFLMEETMFYREPTQDEALDFDEADNTPTNTTKALDNSETEEKISTPVASTRAEIGGISPKKSYTQKLKVWGARKPGQPNNALRSVWLPFTLVRFPVIAMSAVLVGAVLSWFNVVNATIALVVAAPPYNFSTESIGVLFIAPFIGCLVGCVFAGTLGDKIALWKARRNGGIFEPEFRLWLALVPFIIHPAGCILFGVGAAHGIHWVGLAFGLAMVVGTFPIGAAIAINYIIDTHKEVAGDALVTMILIRNSMGFAFSYGVTPWITATGVQNTYIALGFIGMFFWGMPLVFIVFGKKLRKASAVSYWAMVEKQGLKAH